MITVVDYGRGNLYSLSHALTHIGIEHIVSEKPGDIDAASVIVLPGVGAFADAMDSLGERDLVTPLRGAVARGVPLLGICLGMQILAASSEEFDARDGLGVIPGHALAVVVHEPEEGLGGGIPLDGQRPPLPKRRRVVASFVCRHALAEPRPCWRGKDRHQQRGE